MDIAHKCNGSHGIKIVAYKRTHELPKTVLEQRKMNQIAKPRLSYVCICIYALTR